MEEATALLEKGCFARPHRRAFRQHPEDGRRLAVSERSHRDHRGITRSEHLELPARTRRRETGSHSAPGDRCAVDVAIFVDPESLHVLIVRDVPPRSAAVLRGRARASSATSVAAGRPRYGRADAQNLEPYAHLVVVRYRGRLRRRDTPQMFSVHRSAICRRPQTLPSEIARRM